MSSVLCARVVQGRVRGVLKSDERGRFGCCQGEQDGSMFCAMTEKCCYSCWRTEGSDEIELVTGVIIGCEKLYLFNYGKYRDVGT